MSWMTGDPPCWYSGDHYWHGGGICTECGERLRCICGCFVTERGIEAHMESCRVLAEAPR